MKGRFSNIYRNNSRNRNAVCTFNTTELEYKMSFVPQSTRNGFLKSTQPSVYVLKKITNFKLSFEVNGNYHNPTP